MNRIYKVIYSKARQCAMVVSELAKSSQNSSRKGAGHVGTSALARMVTAALAVGALTWGIVPGVSWAADITPGSGDGVAIGTDSNAPKAENVAIGKGASISYSGGVGQPSTGDIVIGGGAHINNYIDQGGGIAIGANSFVENMVGGLERTFDFKQSGFKSLLGYVYGYPKDPTKMVTGIAIGQNTYARSGSVMLGTHNYKGELGDVTVDSANTKAQNMSLFSTTLGANSYSNGLFSSVTGAYSIASSNYDGGENAAKNFGATITGSLNSIESSSSSSEYSGIANSIVGVANRASNSNGSLILGAGNEVNNSITNISSLLSEGKSAGDSAKALQGRLIKAVHDSESGGATLVIGGGNKADYTQKTQILGVNNTVTGTEKNISDYNMIDGFGNTITGASHLYTIGTNNTITNTKNTILAGDDYTNVSGLTDSVIIGNNRVRGKDDKAEFAYFSNQKNIVSIGNKNVLDSTDGSISIGNNNFMWRSGGQPEKYGYDTGNVAIGNNTYINSYVNQGDSIVIGKNATVINMGGSLEKAFAFGRPEGKDYSGSIAIGQNTYARSGSTMIGIHDYQGTLGDLDINFTNGKSEGSSGIGNYQESIDSTTIGNNSYNNGVFSTVVGSYTAVSGLYHNQKWGEKPYGVQNFGAAVLGSLNSVEGLTSTEHNTAGMADSILGSANRTKNANGTIMVGAGNVVEDSIKDFDASEIKTKNGIASPNALSEAMRTSIKNANGGGAASVIGNGNIVDSSTLVSVVGAKNEVYNTKNTQILASNRTIGTKTPDTTSTGDATIEVKAVENSVIIGSASVDSPVTTTKSNVTILGYNANAEVDDGVALGSESVARTGAGDAGYDPTTGKGSKDNSIAWTATRAAVSIGNTDEKVTDKVTRQLTGLAAGTNDTDAVNVAQLKKLGDNTVQYDLNTNKGKITLAGQNGTTITNVKSALDGAKDAEGKDATIATATDDALKNAVNLGDLRNVYNEVNAKAEKANGSHTALTVEGSKEAGTADGVYTGDNILLHATTDATTGKVTYDLKLNNDIMIGNKGKDGVSITGPQGKDGEAGKDGIDGKVGISGKDGKDAVSITGKDGVGHIGLTGPKGADGAPGTSIDISVKNGYNEKGKDGKDGINGEKGVDGTSLTRVVYTDKTGEHQIATMEDGLKFKGDDGKEISKKLNNTLEIIGGANGELTEGNIGVNSTDKGQLKVQLAKDLTGITSISNQKTEGDKTTGAKITLGSDGSVDVSGGKITNVGSGVDASGNYTNTTNAANIGDVQNIVKSAVDSAAVTTNKALAGKANVDASNIGTKLRNADGSAASAEDQKANAENWGSAIGTGEIKADDGRMVTGKTVYGEVRPKDDGNYVKKDKTTGENLSALDSKIGKLDETKTYNYIDSQLTTSISDNLGKLDTQVKNNADAIQRNSEFIQNITNSVEKLGDNAVQYDKDSNKSKVTLGGESGTTITNVKDGDLSDSSTEAVNGKQLYNEQQARKAADNAITEKVTNNTNEITKIKNGDFTDASKTVIKNLSKDAVQVKAGDRIKVDEATDEKTGNKTYTISAYNNGTVAKDDGNLISGGTLYNEVHVENDGSYVKSNQTVGKNLSALDSGLKTTSDLIHTNGDTIQIGGSSTATKIDVSGKDNDGNTTGRVVTGVVTDVQDASSAANVGYVNGVTAANTQQIYRDMNNAYGRLNNNINKAAAGSNALAALHPLDYDPDDKADFAVGYGHYRNANAAAVGAFYHPNENTMVNVGVSLGNGDPGFNAGVSFKIGSGSAGRQAMSKTEMAKVINSQSKEIDALKKDNADKDKRIDALEQKMAEILAKLDKNGK